MKTLPHFLLICLLGLLLGCQARNDENAEATGGAETSLAAAAAPAASEGATNEIIRTAQMRFRVKDVSGTTAAIEAITKRFDGFVELSDASSSVVTEKTIPAGRDSLVEVKEYAVSGTMRIRVPNHSFDSALTEIGALPSFLHYRKVLAENAKLELLKNRLTAEAQEEHRQRLRTATDAKGRKLTDIMESEQRADKVAQQAISNTLANLALKDRIGYSTIQLDFYQPPMLYQERLANYRAAEFEPAFAEQLLQAFSKGWHVLKQVVLALASFWALFLLAAFGYWAYRRFAIVLK